MWICAKYKIFFRSGNDYQKTPFLVVFAITIAVCQIQMILTLIPLQNEHDGMGICAKHINLFSAEMIPRKCHSRWFLAIIIAVCQIQMILTLIPLQNEHDGMQICPKHKNFIQSGNVSQKTPFLVVFGYNNCSVSNPNAFNTHTSSKSTCWDGDMRKTQKFYSQRK